MTEELKPVNKMTTEEFASYFFGMPITKLLFVNQIGGTDKTQVVADVDYAGIVKPTEFIINADTFEIKGELEVCDGYTTDESYINHARALFGNLSISPLSVVAMNQLRKYDRILSEYKGGTNLAELIGDYVPRRLCDGQSEFIKSAEITDDGYALKLGFAGDLDGTIDYVKYVNEVPTYGTDIFPREMFYIARNLFGNEKAYDVVVNNKYGSIKMPYQFIDEKVPKGYQQYKDTNYYVRFPMNNPKTTIDKSDEKKLFSKLKK